MYFGFSVQSEHVSWMLILVLCCVISYEVGSLKLNLSVALPKPIYEAITEKHIRTLDFSCLWEMPLAHTDAPVFQSQWLLWGTVFSEILTNVYSLQIGNWWQIKLWILHVSTMVNNTKKSLSPKFILALVTQSTGSSTGWTVSFPGGSIGLEFF